MGGTGTLTLERLGGGAAYVLQDAATSTTLLLGCGEAREPLDASLTGDSKASSAADDGSGYDSADSFESSHSSAGAQPTRATRRYAHELRALLRRQGDAALTAVLVTDYRPEASFMLPYLTEKCALPAASADAAAPPTLPPVFLTHGTRAIGPHHLAEYWTSTSGSKDKAVLFSEADIFAAFRKTHAVGLKACIRVSEHVKITAYHAGHVAGGCVFYIELGATTVLFARDFNKRGGGRVLLPAAIPRLEPTVLVTRSAFAVTVSETKTAMERELVRVVHECVSAGGKVVVPVYRLGFFHELVAVVLDYWRTMALACPLYVADAAAMQFPSRFTPLVARTYAPAFQAMLAHREANPQQHAAPQSFDWKRLHAPGPFVLFTGPASIAHGDSLRALKACASDPKNLVVLSEHCTPGTVNYSLYVDPQRTEAAKRLGVSVTCGVHYFPCGDEVDAKSIVELAAHVAPQHVLLDAVVPEDVAFVQTHMRHRVGATASSDSSSSSSSSVAVSAIASDAPTVIDAARSIPMKIHKSLFNSPFDVQGMLIAEAKRKLVLVTASNGARRLKKKRHALHFAMSWKKAPEPSTRVKKKSARAPSSALAFLLSAPAESTDDDDDDAESQPHAVVDDLLTALRTALTKWLFDTPVDVASDGRWLKIRSIGVAVSPEWEVHLEWSYDDEELAGRVLGIAKQVVHAEYKRMQQA